jgi:hypothetical protein
MGSVLAGLESIVKMGCAVGYVEQYGNSEIEPVYSTREKRAKLKEEMNRARRAQLDAEAELAQEQAAVNAFRMHCRLKLDQLVDSLLGLRAEKQAYLTRMELLRQGVDLAWLEEDDFLAEDGEAFADDVDDEELLLPTPTPHDKAAEKRLYRELARRFHPDLARTAVEQSYCTTMMTAVNTAYASQDLRALYDIAGELEPGEVAELAGIDSLEIRRLREGIMKARHQRRKARQQLSLLRQENTARLWRRAQTLEGEGKDWWSVVQSDLDRAVGRLELEVAGLKAQLEDMELKSV